MSHPKRCCTAHRSIEVQQIALTLRSSHTALYADLWVNSMPDACLPVAVALSAAWQTERLSARLSLSDTDRQCTDACLPVAVALRAAWQTERLSARLSLSDTNRMRPCDIDHVFPDRALVSAWRKLSATATAPAPCASATAPCASLRLSAWLLTDSCPQCHSYPTDSCVLSWCLRQGALHIQQLLHHDKLNV